MRICDLQVRQNLVRCTRWISRIQKTIRPLQTTRNPAPSSVTSGANHARFVCAASGDIDAYKTANIAGRRYQPTYTIVFTWGIPRLLQGR